MQVKKVYQGGKIGQSCQIVWRDQLQPGLRIGHLVITITGAVSMNWWGKDHIRITLQKNGKKAIGDSGWKTHLTEHCYKEEQKTQQLLVVDMGLRDLYFKIKSEDFVSYRE